jgi:hypothetical protein
MGAEKGRRWETEDRRQKTGDRRRKTGDGREKTGVRRQDGREKSEDRRRTHGDGLQALKGRNKSRTVVQRRPTKEVRNRTVVTPSDKGGQKQDGRKTQSLFFA